MSVITGEAYWARLGAIDETVTTTWPYDVWSIDVCNLDEKNITKAQKDGLNIKNKGDDRGNFVTIRRKIYSKDGSRHEQPLINDPFGEPLKPTIQIGNGSLVNVMYTTYDWELKGLGRKGISALLCSVQVKKLVAYPSPQTIVSVEEVSDEGKKQHIKKEKEMSKKVEDIPILEEENNFQIKKGAFGYIYCITNDSWKDWVKVGMTTGLKARMSGFNSCNPTECVVVDYHLTDKLHFNEHEVHKHFNKFVKKKKRKEKVTASNTTSLEWHNVSVVEARELFTSSIQIIKDKHLEEQLKSNSNCI
jgi:hypothetical protein